MTTRKTTGPWPRCPEHQSTYYHGCKCNFCRAEYNFRNGAYRLRLLARSRGVTDPLQIVDAAECRAVLQEQRRAGKSWAELERLTGIERHSLRAIETGKRKKTRRGTASQIVKALVSDEPLRPTSPRSIVPAKRSQQLVWSLRAQGFSSGDLEVLIKRHLGVPGSAVRTCMREDNVYAQTEETLLWLARQIGDRTGPSPLATKRARSRGWFPLKHYNLNGDLIFTSLSQSDREAYVTATTVPVKPRRPGARTLAPAPDLTAEDLIAGRKRSRYTVSKSSPGHAAA